MDRLEKIIILLEKAGQLELDFLNEQLIAQRDQNGSFEHWARKDVVFHIETWNRRLADNIHRSLRGEPAQRFEDVDGANKTTYDETHQKTWQEAHDFAIDNRKYLNDAVKALGLDGIERTDILPWEENRPIWNYIVSEAYSHAVIHVAEHYRGKGNVERYTALIEQLTDLSDLDDSEKWQGGVIYNTACVHALNGDKEQAIKELKKALHMRPDLVEWSRKDTDLESLHSEPDYQALYEEKS